LPLVLRLGLVLAAVLLGGVLAALILVPAHAKPDEADQENETARRQRLATERDSTAGNQFQAAVDACRGLPTRLTQLAHAAEAKAAALRDAKETGLIAAPHHISPDWRPPWELHRDSPRLPVITWQLLDRAFDQLTATLDDSDSDLDTRACAYEQLATAARQVAKQLDQRRELSSELARCAFCGKPARNVQKIIAGPTSAICDECVDLCAWILDDDLTATAGTGRGQTENRRPPQPGKRRTGSYITDL
jgi:ClpX C4-type zinc finger